MKKSIFAAIALIATTTFAADTGTLLISGTVAAVNDISISPSSYTTLNITGGESNRLVAQATETSNNLAGYKINMKSVNASKLVHNSDSSKYTGYTVTYGSSATVYTLTTSDQTVKNVSSLPGLQSALSDIKVSVTAYPSAPAGTYSDTITLSIVAN